MADEPGTTQNANGADGGERVDTPKGTYDEDQVKALLRDALESNEGYKGLQRAFNKSNDAYQRQLAAKDAELAALKSQTSEMAEGLDYLSNKFIRVLPPEQQAEMADELRQRKIVALEKDVANMRQAMVAPAQPQQFDNEQLEAQMKAILKEAQESLEETARDRGLDPKDKGLDYGAENETFAARLKRLNASIKKLEKDREEKDLADVRPKSATTPTRTTGVAGTGDFTGKSLLDSAFDDIWTRMREEARTGKRR